MEESPQIPLVLNFATSTKNIVLFGETSAGKSLVINLMAGKEMAMTSLGLSRCILKWDEYPIEFDGYNYNVLDTTGLEEPQLGIEQYLGAIVNARNLVVKLESDGGIDLLLFCVPANRIAATVRNNYRLFYEWLCEKKVPIVLVLTGLEQGMEECGARNKADFDRYNIVVDDHACITAADELDGRHPCLYEESRQLVCDLVRKHTYDRLGGWRGGDGWLRRFTRNLRELFVGNCSMKNEDVVTILTKRCGMRAEAALQLAKQVREDLPFLTSAKNIVLFGQTGAGKSSVVNLMAGEEKAITSPDMDCCTMQWKEYSIAFDGFEYKAFETIGLEDPQLGIQEYLEVVLNARNLIMKLKNEGGIDLLLFCMRAGRLTTTLRNNYRLFYEWLCEKKVPIVLVFTGLEYEKNMEDWWTRCRDIFDKYNIIVDGHACITAVNDINGRYKLLYEESRLLIRNLVKNHTYNRPGAMAGWQGGEEWLRTFMGRLRVLIPGNPSVKRKDIKSVLKRRGMPQEAAEELARRIEKELPRKKST